MIRAEFRAVGAGCRANSWEAFPFVSLGGMHRSGPPSAAGNALHTLECVFQGSLGSRRAFISTGVGQRTTRNRNMLC